MHIFKNIAQIKKILRGKYEEYRWKHVLLVDSYAKQLAREYDLDQNLVELAALLHDIGYTVSEKDHHLTGGPAAEKILQQHGYSPEIIEQIKHCIISHSTKGPKPETILAKIITSADALAHLTVIPVYFHQAAHQGYDVENVTQWAEELIEKQREKVILPQAKKMAEDKYQLAKTILAAVRKNYLEIEKDAE